MYSCQGLKKGDTKQVYAGFKAVTEILAVYPVKIEEVKNEDSNWPNYSGNPYKTMLTVVDMNEATHIAIYVVDNHNYDYPILIEKDCPNITGVIQILKASKAS